MNGWADILNVGTIGTSGGCLIFLFAVWRGLLIPERVVAKLLAARDLVIAGKDAMIAQIKDDRDAQIERERAETAEWRGAWRAEQAARLQLQEQNGELLELARTGTHALTAVAQAAGHDDPPH